MNKRVIYIISIEDNPALIWRINLDNTVDAFFTIDKWKESARIASQMLISETDRIIPKREAKSLFPEAFK